jgi:hypothetical protein
VVSSSARIEAESTDLRVGCSSEQSESVSTVLLREICKKDDDGCDGFFSISTFSGGVVRDN